jgi:hypothetical protein
MGADTQMATVRNGEPILSSEMALELLSYARGEKRGGGSGLAVTVAGNVYGMEDFAEQVEEAILTAQTNNRTQVEVF